MSILTAIDLWERLRANTQFLAFRKTVVTVQAAVLTQLLPANPRRLTLIIWNQDQQINFAPGETSSPGERFYSSTFLPAWRFDIGNDGLIVQQAWHCEAGIMTTVVLYETLVAG